MTRARRGLSLVLVLAGLAVLVRGDDQAWVAPAEERAKTNPVASSPEALEKGRFLYRKNCQRCHGAQGRGDGASGRYGIKPPQDLTKPDKQAKLTDGEIFWKITTGLRDGPDVIMPAYKREIAADEDRWKVVLFVRTLPNPSSPAP